MRCHFSKLICKKFSNTLWSLLESKMCKIEYSRFPFDLDFDSLQRGWSKVKQMSSRISRFAAIPLDAHGLKIQGGGYLKFLPKSLGGSRLSGKIHLGGSFVYIHPPPSPHPYPPCASMFATLNLFSHKREGSWRRKVSDKLISYIKINLLFWTTLIQ
jgi:hypothetical protein